MPIHPHDTATFTEIYHEYFNRLFHYAQKFVDMDDAADVLSEVFMGLWRSTAQFENKEVLSVYLYRAVKNKCLNHLQQHHPTQELPDVPDEPAIDHSEIIAKVLRAIDELPDRQRQIITMYDLDELSVRQVAKKVGIKYNSVRSNRAAAMKALRKRLK